jgi:hypothetical protein
MEARWASLFAVPSLVSIIANAALVLAVTGRTVGPASVWHASATELTQAIHKQGTSQKRPWYPALHAVSQLVPIQPGLQFTQTSVNLHAAGWQLALHVTGDTISIKQQREVQTRNVARGATKAKWTAQHTVESIVSVLAHGASSLARARRLDAVLAARVFMM